jgi:hypothetical protein
MSPSWGLNVLPKFKKKKEKGKRKKERKKGKKNKGKEKKKGKRKKGKEKNHYLLPLYIPLFYFYLFFYLRKTRIAIKLDHLKIQKNSCYRSLIRLLQQILCSISKYSPSIFSSPSPLSSPLILNREASPTLLALANDKLAHGI